MTGHKLQQLLDTHYPEAKAYDWDNVGLQVGSLSKTVTGIIISLDLTLDVIDEAHKLGCNWIITHHPLLFRPLTTIDTNSYLGELIERLLQYGITLYSAHTNFDVAPNGLNSILANILQLKNQRILDSLEDGFGLGIIGTLHQPFSVDDYVAVLKQQLAIDHLRVIGTRDTNLMTVAIAGGSGSSVIQTAIEQHVDALITGDVTYHHALDVINQGFLVFDVGHHIEHLALVGIKNMLEEQSLDIPVHLSTVLTNPYQTK